MDRGLILFAVLFLLLPLLALGGVTLLGAGAAIALGATAMVLLLVGFTIALPFVDVD